MYSQPRIGLPALSVFVHHELFTFKPLQFVFAVEIFKWVTSRNIHFVQKGHLPLSSAHYSHRSEKKDSSRRKFFNKKKFGVLPGCDVAFKFMGTI
jgi:hypothetical protein